MLQIVKKRAGSGFYMKGLKNKTDARRVGDNVPVGGLADNEAYQAHCLSARLIIACFDGIGIYKDVNA